MYALNAGKCLKRKYNQTENDFYHKAYYEMLKYIVSYNNSYNNCHIRRGKTQKGKSKTLIEYNGETKTIPEWAKIYNISYYAMRYRIKKYKDRYEMIFK